MAIAVLKVAHQALSATFGITAHFTPIPINLAVPKFSEEVANYVTNDEFISSLSNNLGKPKVTETEEDFVERASRLLKTILEEKFKT